MSDAALLDLVHGLYAAALEPSGWDRAIVDLSRALGCEGGTLEVHDVRRGELHFYEAGGICEEGTRGYAEYFRFRCPRIPVLEESPGMEVVYDFIHMTEREIERSEFYNDFLRDLGLKYYIAGILSRRGDLAAVAAFQRSPHQGHVEAEQMEVMQTLLPHLDQALNAAGMLRRLERRAEDLRHALDALALGAILLDARGRVVFVNAAARAGLSRGWPLAVERGELRARHPGARPALGRALADVLATGGGELHGRARPVPLGDPLEDRPVTLTAIPLPRGDATESLWESDSRCASVLVLVREPGAAALPISFLQALFGLTPAEAKLAVALCRGATLSDYAESERVTIHTVRTHFARLKAKLCAANQAQVVVRLRDLVPPPAAAGP